MGLGYSVMTITPIVDGPLRTAPGPRRRQEEVNVNVMSAQHITHKGRPFRVNYVDLTYREDSLLGVQAVVTGRAITQTGRLSVTVEKVALVAHQWPGWLRELARDYMPDWFRVPTWLDDEDDPPLDSEDGS